jgi:diguanylate cyclase (GGDEF)-like protein
MVEISQVVDTARGYLATKEVTPELREMVLELVEITWPVAHGPAAMSATPESVRNLTDSLLENKKLVTLMRRQGNELDALKRISRNLTSSLEMQTVLNMVVKEAMELVSDSQDAHIYLYQEERLVFGTSLRSDGKQDSRPLVPRLNSLTYHVAKEKNILIVRDIRDSQYSIDGPRERNGSIIAIPLLMGSRVVGVMNLARAHSGDFAESEIRLLALLADQAAIAIINARLHLAVKGQAFSDTLTGLPNRRALDERLDFEIKRGVVPDYSFTVIMMDLDGFKLINDTFGHEVGDDILHQVALYLPKALRSTDFLARYGGDELTLILPDTAWPEAQIVINKVLTQLKELSIQLPDQGTTHVGVSGGVAVFPLHAKAAPDLLRAADEALYLAKQHQRGSFELAQRVSILQGA